ncbi:MAG: Holliday junction resolvase RuvX [Paludibacteraceae bacterium]|nr:Holliday junction resolvase RuvX [Paludibacteraceae bacterium]
MGRILAIDYGRKRTGLAVTDPMRITAQPLETIPTHTLLDWLTDYFSREQVDIVVLGYPKQMSGADSESMNYIRPFQSQFAKRFPERQLVLYDERFTSVLAHRAMIDGGMNKKQRQDKAVVDKIAACIILEDYLQTLS